MSAEEQHYIHMAGADGFEEVDPSDEAEGVAVESEDEQEPMVSALVAAALSNVLLKD